MSTLIALNTMKIQIFKIAAQNSIDDIAEDIDDLKSRLKYSDEEIRITLPEEITNLQEQLSDLINDYNDLNSITIERQNDQIKIFKLKRNRIKSKLQLLKSSVMKKKEFTEKIQSSITAMDVKIEELNVQMNVATGDAIATYNEQLKNLKEKKEKLQAKYNALKNIADDTWEEKKDSFKNDFQSLKLTIKHLFN